MFRVWNLGRRSPAPDGSGHFGKLNEKLFRGDEATVCQLMKEEGTPAACSRTYEVTKVPSFSVTPPLHHFWKVKNAQLSVQLIRSNFERFKFHINKELYTFKSFKFGIYEFGLENVSWD